MFKQLALAALTSTLAPVIASAHGPSRQKVSETVEINAPADKVWAVLGNFHDMSWSGIFVKTEGPGGNSVGATRKLFMADGNTVDEKLNKYDDAGKAYSYEITAVDVKVLPVTNYSATFTVTPQGNKSVVEWKGAFYRGHPLNDPPPELNDEAAVNAVTGAYKVGLENLKKKIESGS